MATLFWFAFGFFCGGYILSQAFRASVNKNVKAFLRRKRVKPDTTKSPGDGQAVGSNSQVRVPPENPRT